jgi:hypothetical protein
LDGIDAWQWFASIGTWLVTLALSVVVGSWVVPWVLRHAGRGDLPWARYEPPVYPQALGPEEVPAEGSSEGAGSEPGKKPGAESEGESHKGEKGSESASGTMDPDAVAILRGGAWLGVLERLAITGSLLAGYPYGIAIVIAIKGLGRYPELRDQPVASERFVVGTLASLIWSVATGLVGLVVLNALVL